MGIQIRPNKKWRQVWRYEDNCFSLFYNSLKKISISGLLFKHWKIIIWNFFDNLQVNILKNRKSFVSYIKHYIYIDIPIDKTIPKYVIYKIWGFFHFPFYEGSRLLITWLRTKRTCIYDPWAHDQDHIYVPFRHQFQNSSILVYTWYK